jgi:predicted nucleotidyltransferase component of viral defense system
MSKNFSSQKYKTHEGYMRKIISATFSSSIAPYLAFKGGTLAYFCYNLDRYSTDIDIDLLNLQKEQEVIDMITHILSDIGEIKSFVVGKYLHRWMFRYDLESTNIKVELNKRVSPYNKYDTQIIDGISVPCMERTSMATNKLLALGERYYNRDLYDTHFFLTQGYQFDENIITERTGLSLQSLITHIIKELPQQYAEDTILAGMGDVLTEQQKSRVKAHLVDESSKQLERYLKNRQ